MIEIIGSGAEAVVHKDKDKAIKKRPKKGYRHSEIDSKLRRSRTKREAKVLEKLHEFGIAPKLHSSSVKDAEIHMEYLSGHKLRDVLHKNHKKWGKEIGKKIAKMHKHDIIHGDLTTSNMIVDEELKLIDFGLSYFSNKEEDKAVDLHLLKRALESKHHEIFEEVFKLVLSEYKKELKEEAEAILKRLDKVTKRGRNKH